MKKAFIRESRKFYGKFEVVTDEEKVIPCYNLATARLVVSRINKSKGDK